MKCWWVHTLYLKTMLCIVWKPPENPIFSENSIVKKVWRSIGMLVCFYTCKNCSLKLYTFRIRMYWKTLGKPDVFLILWIPWSCVETIAKRVVSFPGDLGLFLSMINCYKHALHKRPVYSYTNDPEGVVRTNHVIQSPWLCVVPHPKRERTRRPRWLH